MSLVTRAHPFFNLGSFVSQLGWFLCVAAGLAKMRISLGIPPSGDGKYSSTSFPNLKN